MKLFISAVTWDRALRAGMHQAELAAAATALGCCGVELRQYWHDIVTAPSPADKTTACAYACNEGRPPQSRRTGRKGLPPPRPLLPLSPPAG